MYSRIDVAGTQIELRPASRRATRAVQAVAILFTMLVGAVSCADGSRVSGPFQPIIGEQVRGLQLRYDSVAPAALKSAPRLRSLGASSASRLTARGARALSSASGNGGSSLVAAQIGFAPEAGPFANLLPEGDDALFGKADGTGFDIGFDFTFFGNTYREFFVSTNGFIAFDRVDNGCCEGRLIPLEDEINDIIAVAWSDLNMKYGQVGFETRGKAPNRRLVIDFADVESFDAPGHTITAQLILYEGTNAIEIHTKSLPMPGMYRFTQGIENSLGTDAAYVEGRVESLFELVDDAVRFAPPGGNRPPTVAAGGNAGGPPADRYEGREGQPIAFKATGADIDNDPLVYSWDFNGDGHIDAEGAEVSYAYEDNGVFQARVTVTDSHGLSATASVEVVVANVAPSAEVKAPDAVDEGSPIVVTVGDVSEPARLDRNAGFEYAFNCGDGFGEFSKSESASCPTIDNGSRTVGLKVRDKDGGESVHLKSVEVRNVAPVVNAGESLSVASGQLVNLVGSFSDAGANDRLWRWSWSTPNEGVAVHSRHSASGSVADQGAVTSEYRACGLGQQTLTLAVVDKDGGRGEASVSLVVKPLNVDMKVKPSVVALNAKDSDEDSDSDDSDRHNDDHGRVVTVYIFSAPGFDATSIDPASIRLTNGSGKGTPVAVKKSRKNGTEWQMKPAYLNGDRLRDVKLRFSRNALIANGDLTASTTSLSVVGRAGTCVGLSGAGSVMVKR